MFFVVALGARIALFVLACSVIGTAVLDIAFKFGSHADWAVVPLAVTAGLYLFSWTLGRVRHSRRKMARE